MRPDIIRDALNPLLEPDWKAIQEDIAVKAHEEEQSSLKAPEKVKAIKIRRN